MRDFFDEDFPLSAKQEEEYKKQQELEAAKKAEAEAEEAEAVEDAFDEPIDEGFTIPAEVEFADDDEPYEEFFAGMSETEEIFESLAQDEPELVEEPEAIEEEPAEDAPADEIIEHDPMDSAPIFDLELDEPLDDGFLPDAPIIIPEEAEQAVPFEEDDLSAELRSLTEKLDNMERAVSAMTADETEDDEPADFNYEYDSRYFAEEETTAYKHPELVKKPTAKRTIKKSSGNEMTINLKTLAKVGAVVAGAVVAAKLLSDDKKK